MSMGVVTLYGNTIGFETLTPATATGISSALLADSNGIQAKTALISVDTAAIRFRTDGTNPTNAVGHTIGAGGSYVVTGHQNIRDIRFIDVAGASAVQVSTYA